METNNNGQKERETGLQQKVSETIIRRDSSSAAGDPLNDNFNDNKESETKTKPDVIESNAPAEPLADKFDREAPEELRK